MGAQNKMESPLAITVGPREREGEARLAASNGHVLQNYSAISW